MTNNYIYFVSYIHDHGTGMSTIHCPQPLKTWEDVLSIAELLRNKNRMTEVVVANFQLLSGPDTCTNCGCHSTGQEVAR